MAVRAPKKSEVAAAVPGAATVAVDIVLWLIATTTPLVLRIGIGVLGLALMTPFLVTVTRFVRATWRRGAGFYRFVDAQIEEADGMLELMELEVVGSYPDLLTRYRDWEHRAWSGALAYDDKYGAMVREWYEDDVVANRSSLEEWVTKKRSRLLSIRDMGPPNG